MRKVEYVDVLKQLLDKHEQMQDLESKKGTDKIVTSNG